MSSAMSSAADIVNEFLRLIMIPDPAAASQYTAPDMKILFTGGRAMREPADCTKFNASRYKWVKKRIERTDSVIATSEEKARGETVVYSIGTLYGEEDPGNVARLMRTIDRGRLERGQAASRVAARHPNELVDRIAGDLDLGAAEFAVMAALDLAAELFAQGQIGRAHV